MNRFLALFISLCWSATLLAQSGPTDCAASPHPVAVTQPDGSTITLVGKGSHYLNYTETTDGYTILRNEEGYWMYAVAGPDGELEPSALHASDPADRLHAEEVYLQQVPRQLRHSPQVEAVLRARFAEPQQAHGAEEEGMAEIFPSGGSHRALLILIEYPDLRAQYSTADFERLLNEQGYNGTGSFRDYFQAASNNKLDMQVDVLGWFTASHQYKYYGWNQPDYSQRTRELVLQAADSAEAAGVDFSQYDNDQDGEIDGVFFVHAGPGAEEGGQRQYIWSHRGRVTNRYASYYDGVRLADYIMNPETRGDEDHIVDIGVFCHEFGHLLGLPDLYDTNGHNGISSGIGNWGLMAGGCWLNDGHTPSMLSAWSRQELGWIQPQVVSSPAIYTLHPATTSHECFKIPTDNPLEYFLLENRQQEGIDSALPGHGMAIWHIDELRTALPTIIGVNGDEDYKGVDLEAADGRLDMDEALNRGDGSDLFPGTENRVSFTDHTSPNSRLNIGLQTGIQINHIRELPDSSIVFRFGDMPYARFTASKRNVCKGEEVQFTNNSLMASRFYWDFGNGKTSHAVNARTTYEDEGAYFVKLTAENQDGRTHTDSVLIHVHPDPVPAFEWTADDLTVSFTNTSTTDSSYFWSFGEGGTSTLASPSYTYEQNDSYHVILEVISPYGCKADTQQLVTVNNALRVGPNPFTDELHMTYQLLQQQEVTVSMYNVMGQEYFRSHHIREAGFHRLDLPTHAFPSGIYLLHLEVGNEPVSTIKILKK